MESVNQATIIGYVGEDPKIITTSNGKTMATLTVATTERGYTKRDGTTSEDRTEWHNIVLFGKLAEIARDYIRKGATLYIQGKMRTRSYDDKDGIKRYVTEIHADTVQMLDRRSTATSQQYAEPQQQYGYQQPPMNDPDLPF